LLRFFEHRTEYLTDREWHFEWHWARMCKLVSGHFVDVERLLYREEVLGSGEFAVQLAARSLAAVGGLGPVEEDGRAGDFGVLSRAERRWGGTRP